MLTEFHFTRPSYVAAALEDLYRDAALRQTIAKRCFENATREEYAWDAVSRRWDQLFQQVLSAPSAEIPLNWTPQLVH